MGARAIAVTAAAIAAGTGVLPASGAPTLAWDLIATRPHDPDAFTQGLVAYRGSLLESTGDCCDPSRPDSSVRRVNPRNGRVLAIRHIPAPIFAEGLTVLAGTAWQLTWTDHVAYRVAPMTLSRRGTSPYPREGWGLTTDGRRLVASDGTAMLRWLAPPRLTVIRTVVVRDGARPVRWLNELEMLGGLIWANVWQEDRVALIRPADGWVVGWLDLSALRPRLASGGEVLNGIARDPVTGHVLVTGKRWDRMFVIRLRVPVPGAA